MKSFIFGATLLFLSCVTPHGTQAYLTTAQSAVDVGNGTALLTVTYKFGFLNREVYMPIVAKRNKEFEDKGTDAGYSILFNGSNQATATTSILTSTTSSATLNYTVLPGKSKALVLSEAEIRDGRYYVPKGKSGTFTLIALVDLSKTTSKNDVSLLMTSLPFTMVDKGINIEARLNPSELQYYKTPEVDIKK